MRIFPSKETRSDANNLSHIFCSKTYPILSIANGKIKHQQFLFKLEKKLVKRKSENISHMCMAMPFTLKSKQNSILNSDHVLLFFSFSCTRNKKQQNCQSNANIFNLTSSMRNEKKINEVEKFQWKK